MLISFIVLYCHYKFVHPLNIADVHKWIWSNQNKFKEKQLFNSFFLWPKYKQCMPNTNSWDYLNVVSTTLPLQQRVMIKFEVTTVKIPYIFSLPRIGNLSPKRLQPWLIIKLNVGKTSFQSNPVYCSATCEIFFEWKIFLLKILLQATFLILSTSVFSSLLWIVGGKWHFKNEILWELKIIKNECTMRHLPNRKWHVTDLYCVISPFMRVYIKPEYTCQ